jgi:hypothetical protein
LEERGAASVVPTTLVAELPFWQLRGNQKHLKVMRMSQGSGDPNERNTATSNQMAMLVPSFDPAKDDLDTTYYI